MTPFDHGVQRIDRRRMTSRRNRDALVKVAADIPKGLEDLTDIRAGQRPHAAAQINGLVLSRLAHIDVALTAASIRQRGQRRVIAEFRSAYRRLHLTTGVQAPGLRDVTAFKTLTELYALTSRTSGLVETPVTMGPTEARTFIETLNRMVNSGDYRSFIEGLWGISGAYDPHGAPIVDKPADYVGNMRGSLLHRFHESVRTLQGETAKVPVDAFQVWGGKEDPVRAAFSVTAVNNALDAKYTAVDRTMIGVTVTPESVKAIAAQAAALAAVQTVTPPGPTV